MNIRQKVSLGIIAPIFVLSVGTAIWQKANRNKTKQNFEVVDNTQGNLKQQEEWMAKYIEARFKADCERYGINPESPTAEIELMDKMEAQYQEQSSKSIKNMHNYIDSRLEAKFKADCERYGIKPESPTAELELLSKVQAELQEQTSKSIEMLDNSISNTMKAIHNIQ